MTVYGPQRGDGDYQHPRTDATALKRGLAVRRETWTIGTEEIALELVPMLEGRPELYELAYQRNDPVAKRSIYNPCMIRGEIHARMAFALTASQLDAGFVPDAVIVPDGTPLGP